MSQDNTDYASDKPVKKLQKKGMPKLRSSGMDRRLKHKHQTFEQNMYLKMDGKEIPETRRAKKNEMPVSPAVLAVCLFLVIGSAFFQVLQTWQSGSQTVE